jgi:hypothetical protein
MKYTAVNTKVHAMGADGDCQRVVAWLHDKKIRDFVQLMMPERIPNRDIPDYLLLWKKLNRLDKKNRRVLHPLIGTEIDLRNMIWMYRLKRFYNVAGDATYGRLIPIRYRLTEALTREMVDSKDEKNLHNRVALSPYAAVFPSFERPERLMYRALSALYKKAARYHPHSLAAVCAFLYEGFMRATAW